MSPLVSVLMPTFRQAPFVCRAIESLLASTFEEWELAIVDDGSPDATGDAVSRYLDDPRVTYTRLERNVGLGAALNVALGRTTAPLVAYLPSDDVWYPEHLAELVSVLDAEPGAALAFSGVDCERRVPGKGVVEDLSSDGQIDGLPLQLVQVAHRRVGDRWLERDELVTDDLDRMYWHKVRAHGSFEGTGNRSCHWVDHPDQRHKIVQEPYGGVNRYRSYYGVAQPLRFSSTKGNPTDEVEHYRRFRERPDTPRADDGLKILLVGELAFNPERVLALEERGHQLYGLWTPEPHWFNAVGPVPFGHVTDLPRHGWREAVAELQPDVIYGLLNWVAVPFSHRVLEAAPDVPFVWHLKEGPFDCIANGTWPQLRDLHTRSAGQVYSSPEMREWFALSVPETADHDRSLVLDGDLPKADWFTDDRSRRLAERDGDVHLVVPGGPIGVTPELVAGLAKAGVHLHFYGDFHRGQWPVWTAEVQRAAPDHFHLHPQVNHDRWVAELSQYDAGVLHLLRSPNGGDLRRADWGDLNYPARMATLASAGLPFVQLDNKGSIVAQQNLALDLDIGVFFKGADDLAAQLHDEARMQQLRDNVWRQREVFTFDHHADRLVELFRRVIAQG